MWTVKSPQIPLAILLACNIGLVSTAWSCTGTPSRVTVEEKTKLAGVVILGKAIKNLGSVGGGYSSSTKIIEVSKWLKGDGPRYVIVGGFGSSAACLVDVPLAQEFVLFGSLDRATGNIHLNYTGLYDAVEKADVASRATIAAGSPPSDPRQSTPIRARK